MEASEIRIVFDLDGIDRGLGSNRLDRYNRNVRTGRTASAVKEWRAMLITGPEYSHSFGGPSSHCRCRRGFPVVWPMWLRVMISRAELVRIDISHVPEGVCKGLWVLSYVFSACGRKLVACV